MRKTRKTKRKPRGTLRRSRRYRRGGYVNKYSWGRKGLFSAVNVGGKRRKPNPRSSRKKRGGTTTVNHPLRPMNVS